jgi:imidazolonepropionase-like amidohydrolase
LHRALDGGCDSIEHGLDLDDAAIAQMVKQGTWYCPTITPYYYGNAPADTPGGRRDKARVDAHVVSFQKAMKAGVKIVFGTDIGGYPWSESMAQEFRRMVEMGMSPADALRSATSSAAEMLGMTGEIGVVAPGAYADVIAVGGDPLADVRVLEQVSFVMKDGRVFKGGGAAPLR